MNNRGSSTVEAAFIVPLILFIILAFIYIGFYFMDIAKIAANSELVVNYASDCIAKSRDLKTEKCDIKWRNQQNLYANKTREQLGKIQSILEERLQIGMVTTKVDTASVVKSGSAMKVEVRYAARRSIWRYFGLDTFVMNDKFKVELGDFADYLRKKTVLEDMVHNDK